MSVLPITIYGDRVLSEKTKPIEQVDDSIIILIQNMFETMRKAQGVGLAANQVGVDKSIFTIDIKPVEGYEDFKPIVMINPEIVLESDEEVYFDEGCLSLPGLHTEVVRSEKIKVKYLDTDENEQEIEADDFFARVILHEYDHLIGKMIPDRLSAGVKASLKEELILIRNREAITDYPVTEKE